MLLKWLMTPAGYKFDRWLVRWTGDSLLVHVFAWHGGYTPSIPLLLEVKGRKSGKTHGTVLSFFDIDAKLFVVGSSGGSPVEPQWVRNLRADPDATIYIRRRPRRVKARIAAGEERQGLWEKLIAIAPTYAEFQAKIDREIPLVILE
jgi:deazaflavin-dependent oxidoreductase (nitroreductase family)